MVSQYSVPAALGMVTIATMTGEDVLAGDLTAISPEEDRIAFVLRIEERILEGADDEELMGWRGFFMRAPAEFICIDNAKRRFYVAIRQRRTIVKQGVSVKRSAMQVTQEIMSAWDTEQDQKLSAQKLQAVYAEQLGDIEKSEDAEEQTDPSMNVSKTTIEIALSINKGLLYDEQAAKLINYAEETLQENSPWHTMSNLKQCAQKLRANKDDGIWIMEVMLDLALEDPVNNCFSARSLCPRNEKGLFDK